VLVLPVSAQTLLALPYTCGVRRWGMLMGNRRELRVIRYLFCTSVFLGGSAPTPPAFDALGQWHEERPWQVRRDRCGAWGPAGEHPERRSSPVAWVRNRVGPQLLTYDFLR